MRLTQSQATAATAAASLVAATALMALRLAPSRISPTPEELADRFSVFVNSTDPSIAVAQRILALDANGDTYVARHELPERMQGLIERGDQNGDGTLTTDEVLSLVRQAPPSRRSAPLPPFPQKAVDVFDIVSDLRLSPDKYRRVRDILRTHIAAGSDLELRLRDVLNDEEYGDFVAAAARINGGRNQ
jgi:hypothetical protein